VEFLDSHALTAFDPDARVNPLWTPGSAAHAAAYTRGSAPKVNARFPFGSGPPTQRLPPVTVRVKEAGTVRGTQTGVTPTDTVEVTGLTLTGLTGSAQIRSQSHTLEWETSVDGASWLPLKTPSFHLLHWLHGAPLETPTRTLAVSKALSYANGTGTPGAAAAEIRSGLRRDLKYSPKDPINADPLTVFADGVGICTDFGNLMALLARSIGLTANTVMFWGGFETVGTPVWITLVGSYRNLSNVHSPRPELNPPDSPAGWSFNYHVIARVEGTLHDPALDRIGIEADAIHAGKVVHLVELAGTPLPGATMGSYYVAPIPRRDHVVTVTTKDYGARIDASLFDTIVKLELALTAASPADIPVGWAVTAGSLPAELKLDPKTGIISGTLASKGVAAFTVTTQKGALIASTPLTLTVT
jgi:hypothetical protein